MGQQLVPMYVSRAELVEVLEDILNRVKEGDSVEGNFEYLIPDPEAEADLTRDYEFSLKAVYRRGNLGGQGGMRIIGNWEEVDDDKRR